MWDGQKSNLTMALETTKNQNRGVGNVTSMVAGSTTTVIAENSINDDPFVPTTVKIVCGIVGVVLFCLLIAAVFLAGKRRIAEFLRGKEEEGREKNYKNRVLELVRAQSSAIVRVLDTIANVKPSEQKVGPSYKAKYNHARDDDDLSAVLALIRSSDRGPRSSRRGRRMDDDDDSLRVIEVRM